MNNYYATDEINTYTPDIRKKNMKKKPAFNFKRLLSLHYLLMAFCVFFTTSVSGLVSSPFYSDLVFGICEKAFGYDAAMNVTLALAELSGAGFVVLSILLYAICAFLSARKISGMFRFVGVAATAVMVYTLLMRIINVCISLIVLIFEKSYIPVSSVSPQNSELVAMPIVSLVFSFGCAVVAAVIGVALLLFANNYRKDIAFKKIANNKKK